MLKDKRVDWFIKTFVKGYFKIWACEVTIYILPCYQHETWHHKYLPNEVSPIDLCVN